MKKLKKTLALVLALAMLISAVPFMSNADTAPSAAITLSKVNGEAYDEKVPARSGDTLSFDVTISRDSASEVRAWALGFSFDSDALVLSGITWGTAWATYGKSVDNTSYIQLGSVSMSNVSAENEVVATLNFTVESAFTGSSAIATNLGSNYVGINNGGTINRTDITVAPAEFTVYPKVDNSNLKAQLDAAAALTESNYIPSKWELLNSAVEAGQLVYDNVASTQDDINTAASNIETAIANLQLKGNKTELQTEVNKARIELTKTVYTADSLAALQSAVDNAEAVIADDNAIQSDVDAQLALVKSAISGLKYSDVTVTFLNADGSVFDTQTVPYGGSATLPENVPTKASDETYNYVFASWEDNYTNVTSSVSVHPNFTRTYIEYTIIFNDEDGTEIANSEYHYGDTVTVPDAPEKAQDDTYTYAFSGWTPEVDVVKGSVTYTATYEATFREYTVKFVNYDETEISSQTYHWADEVTVPTETPTKPADVENTYEFAGWSPEVTAVSGNATYVAQFTATKNLYTVSFVNYDDSVISEQSYTIGETVQIPTAIPTKPNDDMHYYTFKGWSPEVVTTCAGGATYKATYEAYYLDADYSAVDSALAEAMAINVSDYTEVSYARVTTAMAGVTRDLTIDKQAEVNAMAEAINNAIKALVSTTAYDSAYAKCAAVNNDNNQFTPDSYTSFVAAMNEIGAKKDFNTESATQAEVDTAKTALDDAYALLEASTLTIDGAKKVIYNGDAFVISANTNANTTSLVANDGGANISVLKFYDKEGNEITNKSQAIGTGCTVKLLQNGEVKLTKLLVVYGDINGDGQVSIADIALAKKYATDPSGFTVIQDLAALCGNETFSVDAVIDLAKAL